MCATTCIWKTQTNMKGSVLFSQHLGPGDQNQVVRLSLYRYVCMWTDVQGGQKHQVPLELQLQAIISWPMWMLGTELRLSRRALCASNH